MILLTDEHERISKYILTQIRNIQGHSVSQQEMRKYFTNPYKLHEYDLVLKILKDFEVIQHNRIDRLIIGKAFYTYKNLKVLTNNGQSNIIGVIKDSMIKHIKEIIIGIIIFVIGTLIIWKLTGQV
jgi:hypothetical protein